MKNFLKNIYSKLNKGLLYTILVGIIYIISIRYWFYLQHDSSVQFLFALIMKFGINLLIILLPLLMIITSQKFTKKEKAEKKHKFNYLLKRLEVLYKEREIYYKNKQLN